jgi:hypothetical protein
MRSLMRSAREGEALDLSHAGIVAGCPLFVLLAHETYRNGKGDKGA